MKTNVPTHKEINSKYEAGYKFNQQIGLYDTVQVNEDFFIGKQWEGVQSNGLPTPMFNFLKQVVLFQVATITSENLAMQASALPSASQFSSLTVEQVCEIVNHQFAAIIERTRLVTKLREFLRNAAVDGDGCLYVYFDPEVENGQPVKGEIAVEVLENTRVIFGNPNNRDVQRQPFVILARRELLDDVKYRAEENVSAGHSSIDIDSIKADSEKFQNKYDAYTDDKVTVLTYLYKNRETKTIWCAEAIEDGMLRDPYDTKCSMYPLVWLNWDYIHDCYHGQAMISGLVPNQKFINKMFAMVGVSQLTMAFPKVIYDQNRIRSWNGGVGTAVGVQGNVDGVAKTIDGAPVNPQIAQFMELCIDKTRSFLGASDVAMGDSRPDNTSAIIALQRAANTPMEMTKQNLYQCIEDLGRICMDIMAAKFGKRTVEVSMEMDKLGEQPLGMQLKPQTFRKEFDFEKLRAFPVAIKLDAGASSYWSEIANMQTLDNLLMNNHITLKQYLERLPSGYISKKNELIQDIIAQETPAISGGTGFSKETSDQIPVEGGPGNGQLQRALNREGA